MSTVLFALAALASAPPPPVGTDHIECAFDKAAELAINSTDTPDVIAEEVVSACVVARDSAEPTGSQVRAAAIAMVNRQRGTDGQPADAPIRLPNLVSSVPIGTVEIPDEIAPAVIPYMDCRTQKSNADPRMPTSDVEVSRAIHADARAACDELRRMGTEASERVLKRDPAHTGMAERQAFVAGVFDQVDRIFDGTIDQLEALNAAARRPKPQE